MTVPSINIHTQLCHLIINQSSTIFIIPKANSSTLIILLTLTDIISDQEFLFFLNFLFPFGVELWGLWKDQRKRFNYGRKQLSISLCALLWGSSPASLQPEKHHFFRTVLLHQTNLNLQRHSPLKCCTQQLQILLIEA